MTFSAAIAAAGDLSRLSGGVASLSRPGRPAEPVYGLLGRITGSSSLGSRRWLYSWVEAELDSSDNPQDRSGGRSGYAINAAELGNGSGVVANGVDPANFTGTFDVAVAADYVWLTPSRRSDGTLRWVFGVPVIDGEC